MSTQEFPHIHPAARPTYGAPDSAHPDGDAPCHSLSSPPAASDQHGTEVFTAPVFDPMSPPMEQWVVTMPFATLDGRQGTQDFVVSAPDALSALAAAVTCANEDHAARHRRHAAIDTEAAVIALWQE